jgi:hypothetical protein
MLRPRVLEAGLGSTPVALLEALPLLVALPLLEVAPVVHLVLLPEARLAVLPVLRVVLLVALLVALVAQWFRGYSRYRGSCPYPCRRHRHHGADLPDPDRGRYPCHRL